MRIITSLIIAGVVGSAAVATLTRYMGATSDVETKQTLKAFVEKDRPGALRLLERTASSCIPELGELKSNNARKLFPRIIVLRMDTIERRGDELTDKEAALIDKEIRQLILAISETDRIILAKAMDRMEKEKAKFQNCVSKALSDIARKQQQKPLLSDVELRGS